MKKARIWNFIPTLTFFLSLLSVGAATAQDEDPFTQMKTEMREVLEQTIVFLDEDDLTKVKSNVDYLTQLVGQMRGALFSVLLPQALDGWTQNDTQSQAASAMAFGGGTTATGTYSADDDGRQVTVEYVTDSPLIAAFSAMMNPMLLAQSGNQTFRIETYTFMEEGDELKGMVGQTLVNIKDGTQADRVAYANALPFDDIESFQ